MIHLPAPPTLEIGGAATPTPKKLTIDPGYYLLPTATPDPLKIDHPWVVMGPIQETEEVVLELVIPTPLVLELVNPTPVVLELVNPTPVVVDLVNPTPVVLDLVNPTPTDLFDPYAGSTPPPTDLFNPFQGATPTPFLLNPGLFKLKTPTPQ